MQHSVIVSYLQRLSVRAHKEEKEITITDIQSGFVDTQMAKRSGLFWVASSQKVAIQIYTVIFKKRKHGYTTKRWRIIALLLKILPDRLYHRL